jgi:hypothetical protein
MQFDVSRMRDFEYYSKNLLKIQTGVGLVPFDFRTRYVQTQINKEWEKCLKAGEPIRFIVLKARRHGVSTYVQARMFHGCHTQSHRQAITIAADDDGCGYIHNMSQIYYEYLPDKLKPATKQKNVQRMVFDYPKTRIQKEGGKNYGLKSSLKTVSCTNKAGLGTGNHFIHFSEYAMYRDAEGVRKGVIPTAFNEPGTFVVIESTANGMSGHGGPFYEEWQRAKAGKSVFKPLFYSWLQHEGYTKNFRSKAEREELLDTLDSEERELQDRDKATLEQLNWRRFQISFLGEHGGDAKSGLENFQEQYPSDDREAFIVSGRSVFSRPILKLYYDQCTDEIERYTPYNGTMRKDPDGDAKVWKHPVKGKEYVMAIDPASGEPGATDYAGIEVFEVGDINKNDWGEQCLEWHGKCDADELAKIACIIGYRYNTALAAPEIFGYGHAVLGAMMRNDYPNILRRTQVDAIAKTYLKKYGWNTNPTTKPSMLTLGRYVVNNKMIKIHSKELVMEMITFVRDEGGSGASAYGRGKDDLVMTFLIVLKAIEQEYADNDMSKAGVDPPNSEAELINKDGTKKDKLYYDTFWDEHPSGDDDTPNWQDL